MSPHNVGAHFRAGQFFADSILTHFYHIWVNMSQTEHFSAQKNKKNPAGPRGVLITGPTPFHSIKPEIKTPLGPAGFFFFSLLNGWDDRL